MHSHRKSQNKRQDDGYPPSSFSPNGTQDHHREKASQASSNAPGFVAMRLGQKLPLQIIDRFAEKVNRRIFKSGGIITHEGEKGDEIFYLERGKASVFMTVNGQAEKIRSMAKNQFLGRWPFWRWHPHRHCYCRGRHLLINLTPPGFRKIEKGISKLFYAMGVIAEEK